MREYVGHLMAFVAQGFAEPFKGTLVNEDVNFLYLKSESKKEVWRLIRSKICGFTVLDKEPEDFTPLLVLSCDCKNIGCAGVQYVKEGPGFTQKDIDTFTSSCPCKSAECRVGSKGELRGLSSVFLSRMLTGMLFGDYPAKKEAKRANSRSGHSAKTEHGETEGGGSLKGEQPPDGGTGQPAQTAE